MTGLEGRTAFRGDPSINFPYSFRVGQRNSSLTTRCPSCLNEWTISLSSWSHEPSTHYTAARAPAALRAKWAECIDEACSCCHDLGAMPNITFTSGHACLSISRGSATRPNVGTARQESGGPSRRRPAVHRIGGGKLHGFWYAFGDHDAYTLWEAPDNQSMAAASIAISAGGALTSLHTSVLLTGAWRGAS